MARGGINKVVVENARNALLAKGHTPSIDAVRIELGNTGSRTTIHRYLRELELTEVQSRSSEDQLSQELRILVGQLAARLSQEADLVVSAAQERHDQERTHLVAELAQSRQAVRQVSQQNEGLVHEITRLKEALDTLQHQLHVEQREVSRRHQELSDLKERLADKDQYLASLEDKHQHAREALEHYRQATKEQRDQEHRRHEHQVQQLHAEIRQLQQTQIVKQHEITGLTQDNARLAAELRDARKQVTTLEKKRERLEADGAKLHAQLQQAQSVQEESQQVQAEYTRLQEAYEQEVSRRQQLELELAATRAESATIERLLTVLQLPK